MRWHWTGLLLCLVTACDDGTPVAEPPVDATRPDSGAMDATPDGGPMDAAVTDARVDAAADADPMADAAPTDAGPGDATPVDMALVDATPPDAAPFDAMPLDAGPVDASVPDAAPGCASEVAPPWSRRVERAGGVLTFNELLADPAEERDAEWIELHNTLDVALDISGWALTDGVSYTFPAGTRVPPRGYVVVAAAPERLPGVDALGPYEGRLSAAGERLALRNNTGRLMDALDWTPGRRWPAPPENAGISIAKRDPRATSGWGEAWALGPVGGTPGARNGPPPQGEPPQTLVRLDARWRVGAAEAGVEAAAFDDREWAEGAAPFYVGEPPPADVPVRITADNHFAAYVGGPAGEGLRLLGRDSVGDWTSSEVLVAPAVAGEHLFIAAWEGRGVDGGPQMLLAQAQRPDGSVIGTGGGFEAIVGPPEQSPGGGLEPPAPAVDAVVGVIAAAEWAPPAVSRPQGAAPWGQRINGAFDPAVAYVWPDTFENLSATNADETYALFRSREPLLAPPGTTPLPEAARVTAFRTRFDFAGDPAAVALTLDLLADDGAVVWLNGIEVHRQNLPVGPLAPETPALAVVDPAGPTEGIPIAAAPLIVGENVLVVAVHQADEAPADLRFAAAVHAAIPPPAPPPPTAPVTGVVVINELMYHPPVDDPRGEWIELHNVGPEPVDLAGWRVVDAVAGELAGVLPPGGFGVVVADRDAFGAAHPAVPILGAFEGGLANAGERVALLDACGDTIDEVRYFDRGAWPRAVDGYGPSLELRDPAADNARPGAWRASDERGEWVELSWRGPAGQSAVGPDGQWEELVIGLLDAGEVLIDDVSVVVDPDGAATELIEGGGFDDDSTGWRLLGTHRMSEVVSDPDDPENAVLRLVATGSTEHMHNHAEVTLAGGHRIDPAAEYRISLRARWISGSNQLNARLYFNRLVRTFRLPTPSDGGTPGAVNSVATDRLGPTCAGLVHAPALPTPGAPAEVRVDLSDPTGVARATLQVSVDGGPFEPTPMDEVLDGRFAGTLPTDVPGARLQFYVEAEDGAGAIAFCPPAGPDSRALAQIDDGRWPTDAPLPPFRIILTPGDDALLHAETSLMSNDRVGATVVDGEGRIYYDVGVRLKGSQRGRPRTARLGYSVRFRPENLFRGVYSTVSIDRSEGVGYGQREMLIDLVMAHAGSVSAEYNDLAWLVSPRPEHEGPAQLQLARFGDLMLANQFENGADGRLYEYELVYYPTTTDDGTPTGRKRPQPDRVVGTRLRGLGEDPEAYRHIFLVKNNRREDDFAAIIAFAQVFGLPDDAFRARVADVIDVDQWLRSFAFSALAGAVDHYAGGAQHNVQFYVRPSDDRVLFFPHDLDFYRGDPRRPIVSQNDLRRLLAVPGWRRIFYRHLHAILESSYNPAWLEFWRDHLGGLLPGQNFVGHHDFMVQRAAWIREEAPDAVFTAVPPVDFAVTTEGPLAGPEAVIEGTAWLDVLEIVGPDGPLALEWLTESTWRATLRVPGAARTIRLTARGADGVLGEVMLAVE